MNCIHASILKTSIIVYIGLLVMSSCVYLFLHKLRTVSVHFSPNKLLSLNNEKAIRELLAKNSEPKKSRNQEKINETFVLLVSNYSVESPYSESFWNNKVLLEKRLETLKNPLLTLFTTWPLHDKNVVERSNTLMDWAFLKPYVKCVFFYNNGTNVSDIKKHGWDALQVSNTSSTGIPILKHMFLDAMAKYKSIFYGYANGDILFDVGLLQTLRAIAMERWKHKKPFLIVGRRTNVKYVKKLESKDVPRLHLLGKKGKIFRPDAEDYFITDSSFPWADILGVVIGRPAYDNWLVLHACKQKYHVIDVSKTVLALHQTTEAGNSEGRTRDGAQYNSRLISKNYKRIKYGAGNVLCTPWYTEFKGNMTITIIRRTKLHKVCYKQ